MIYYAIRDPKTQKYFTTKSDWMPLDACVTRLFHSREMARDLVDISFTRTYKSRCEIVTVELLRV